MLQEIIAHSNLLDVAFTEVKDRIFHPSGWSAPNDTDSGISFGDGVEGGLGYMRMDIRDDRSNTGYTLRGGYVELGFGLGETIGSKALTTSAGKAIAKWAEQASAKEFVKKSAKIIELINKYLKKPQTDLVFMPGGSLTEFMMGPFMTRGSLTLGDFRNATWCFIYIEGDAGIGGNIGFMFMVNSIATLIGTLAAPVTGGSSLVPVLAACTAWAPYWGLGVSLSLDVKVSIRLIQDVQLVPLSTALL